MMLRNKAKTISGGCYNLFQVRFHFNCESLKLGFPNTTDYFHRSIILHPLTAYSCDTGGCDLLSGTWQQAESLCTVQACISGLCLGNLLSSLQLLLDNAHFLCFPYLAGFLYRDFDQSQFPLMCYFGFYVCVRAAFRSPPSNSYMPILCLSARELILIQTAYYQVWQTLPVGADDGERQVLYSDRCLECNHNLLSQCSFKFM